MGWIDVSGQKNNDNFGIFIYFACLLIVIYIYYGGMEMQKILAMVAMFVLSAGYAHSGAIEDGKAFAGQGQLDRAAQKYKMACDGKNMEACGLLAEIYAEGSEGSIRPNATKAISLYDKACKGNDAFSCNNLAQHYAKGDGVRKDLKKAIELFNKACKLKDANACENAKTVAEFMKNDRPTNTYNIRRNVYINRNGYNRNYTLGGDQSGTGTQDNMSFK